MSEMPRNGSEWGKIIDFTWILWKWRWNSSNWLEMIQIASVLLFELSVQEAIMKAFFSLFAAVHQFCGSLQVQTLSFSYSHHFLDALFFKDFCTTFLVAAADFSTASTLLHKFSTWRDQWYCQLRKVWEDPGGCWLSEPLLGQGAVLEIRTEPLIWMTSCPCNSKLMGKARKPRKDMDMGALGDWSAMWRVTSLNHKQKTTHHKQVEYPDVSIY